MLAYLKIVKNKRGKYEVRYCNGFLKKDHRWASANTLKEAQQKAKGFQETYVLQKRIKYGGSIG